MPDPTVGEIMDALAEQIQDALCGTADPLIEQLNVAARMVFNPTPPYIDIYPAEVFTSRLSFSDGDMELYFTVRARVSTADSEGGQDLLLSMMDPRAAESVAAAIEADDTLGGVVDQAFVGDPTGFSVWPSVATDVGTEGNLLGCVWQVRVLP